MPALCSGLSLRSSPEHSASPSLYLAQQAATDGPELTATSGPRLLAKLSNTDEMLFDAGSLTEFASQSSQNLQPLFTALEVRAAATREAIGEERLAWLRTLPRIQFHDRLALVHASPKSLWRAPSPEAGDAELEGVYSPLDRTVTVYGHIHRSYIRKMPGMTVANSGSVSLSYDGDCRAAYLLLDEAGPSIRRVEYDVEAEIKALQVCGLPHSGWVARMLGTASFQMP